MAFGAPTVTGYSPFYTADIGIASAGNEASYNAMARSGRSSTEYQLARIMAKPGFRGMRRVMKVLTGAVAGSAASETYSRVAAQTPFAPETAGGLRTIETATANSGNTTSAQETYIETYILDMRYNQNPSSYPTDASGNGGGGKLGV